MQAKTWAAILVGFVGGIVVTKIWHHFQPSVIVEVGIPERDIPVEGPSMREVNRNPQKYGRGKIF